MAGALARGDWLPGACVLCAAPVAGPADLCAGCAAELPSADCACARCGRPRAGAPGPCECASQDWPLHRALALASYAPPVDRLINAFKHRAGLAEGRSLSLLLAERVRRGYAGDSLPDALVAVPMHWRRRLRRGFNQADEIARALSRRLGLPLASSACRRVRHTAPQQTLGAVGRRSGVESAFRCRQSGHRHLAVVDDVVTTGATAAAVARSLRERGARRIDLWCLARAPAPGEERAPAWSPAR